jgi:transposase-like protein
MMVTVADAHAHVQRFVSVVKMATMREECNTEKDRSVVRLWAKKKKKLNAKGIHEETVLVYDGKCLSRKTIHTWVEKFSQRRLKVADDARPGAEVREITVKLRLC